MKNSLVFPDTDKQVLTKEFFRSHLVVSYVANYCNFCIRIQPMMDKLSQRFSRGTDGIIFDRFDLDENDFDFLEFDKVPKIMFYPKGLYEKRTEIDIFDEN